MGGGGVFVNQFLTLLGIVLALMAVVYTALGVALWVRRKRHGAHKMCASVQVDGRAVHGCVCREKGSCEERGDA